MMKVLIAGMDGYLGWPLAMSLSDRGHSVIGIDNFSRRKNVKEIGSWSATPIKQMKERLAAFKEVHGKTIDFYETDLRDYQAIRDILKKYKPDTLVHLGEIPSAPYSMIDVKHAVYTQENNIIGNLNVLFAMHEVSPETHLLKLGTMGEYGTPNVDIPEGFFEIEYHGRKDKLPFPRQPGSWYHLTKVHDSQNIIFACKIWNLRSTDIMQGVVHGVSTEQMVDEKLLTRFDFDEVWGTALNRFCAQAIIGHDLTPYGKGKQTRAYLALRDSMQCLTIATENPPEKGEYRVFNQFHESYSANELVAHVVKIAGKLGIEAKIWNVENPRMEAEEHYYNPAHEHLRNLGFTPTHTLDQELTITISKLIRYKDRIEAKRNHILPTVYWKNSRKKQRSPATQPRIRILNRN